MNTRSLRSVYSTWLDADGMILASRGMARGHCASEPTQQAERAVGQHDVVDVLLRLRARGLADSCVRVLRFVSAHLV